MHAILALLVTIIWGFLFVVSKFVLSELTPFLMLALRLGMVIIFGIWFFPKPPFSLRLIFKISVIFTILHFGCTFWGLYLGLDSSLAIVVEQIGVPFVLILGVIYFKETVKIKTWGGIALSMVGTFILMGSPNSIQHPLAFLLMIASGIFWAMYSIELKKCPKVHPVALMVWIAIVSLPMVIFLSLIFEDNQMNMLLTLSFPYWLGLMYIGVVVSVIAHGLWYYLVQRYPIQSVAPFTLLVPVIGVFGGILFLNEPLTFQMILGTVVMLIGLAIVNIQRPKIFQKDIDA